MIVCSGRLPGAMTFGWLRIERKADAPVVEDHARALGDDARAETEIGRVDETDGVAVLVDDGDVDRVAVHRHVDGRKIRARVREIDHPCQTVRSRAGQHMLDRHRHFRRVGEQGIARRVGKSRRLDLDVQPVGGERIALGLEARQDVEDHERYDALAVRRAFVDVVAAETRLDRRHILAPGDCEILQRVQTAAALQQRDHLLRDLSRVEGVASLGRDSAEGRGEFGLPVHLTDLWRAPLREKDPPCDRIGGQHLCLLLPVEMHAGRDGIAVLGELDCWSEQRAQRQRAMIGVELGPGVDGAGNHDGMRRLPFEFLDALGCEPRGSRGRGGATGSVIGDDLAGPLLRHQHETVSADAGRSRFDDALDGAGGYGRIERVAARFQDPDGSKRGRGMRRRGHAMPRDDDRTVRFLEIPHRQHDPLKACSVRHPITLD